MKKISKRNLPKIIKSRIVEDYENGFAIDASGNLVSTSKYGEQKIDELQRLVERQYAADYFNARTLEDKLRQAQDAYRAMVTRRLKNNC